MQNQHLSEEMIFSCLIETAGFHEMAEAELHFENCDLCSRKKIELAKWVRLFEDESCHMPEENMLLRSRNLLDARLRQQENPVKKRRPVKLFRRIPAQIETRQLAFAVCMLLIGVFLGRAIRPGIQPAVQQDLMSALMSAPAGSYKVIPADSQGNLEFRFKNTQETTTYQGSLYDPLIQSALGYALMTESGENTRLRTMDMIQVVSQNETVEEGLLYTLLNDPNPGMRYRAIKLLIQLPVNKNMKDLLVQALFREENPGVRIEVVKKLLQSDDPLVLPLLEKRAEKDEYVHYALEAEKRDTVSISHE